MRGHGPPPRMLTLFHHVTAEGEDIPLLLEILRSRPLPVPPMLNQKGSEVFVTTGSLTAFLSNAAAMETSKSEFNVRALEHSRCTGSAAGSGRRPAFLDLLLTMHSVFCGDLTQPDQAFPKHFPARL